MDLLRLYDKAVTGKNMIFAQYTDIAKYTMPYLNMDRTKNISVNKKIDEIESVILQSSNDLNNLIMYSMISGGKWATVKLNEDKFNEIKEGETIDSLARLEFSDLNKSLQKSVDKVFSLIYNSTFSSCTSKALNECLNLGTGCIKVLEQDDLGQPFDFQFISISELYMVEDIKGKPSNVFRNYSNIEGGELKELFNGLDSEFENDAEYDVVESCVLNSDGTYTHRLSDSSLQKHYFEYVLDYQIYQVFRWNTSHANSYGLGIGFDLIDEFKRLKEFKKLYEESAVQLVYPPLLFTGSIQYMQKISFRSGDISYGGQDSKESGVTPINPVGQLIDITNDIAKMEMNIRDSYISNPIGNYNDRANVTKAEISTRMDMFRERFSQTYSLISDELLKATFITVFKILITRNIVDFDMEYVPLLDVEYLNEISKLENMEQATKLVQFKNVLLQSFPNLAEVAIKEEYVVPKIAELNDLDPDAYASTKELETYTELVKQATESRLKADELTESPTGGVENAFKGN